MERNFQNFVNECLDFSETPQYSPDKLSWLILKNVPVHRSPEGQVFVTFPFATDGRMVLPIRDALTHDCVIDRYIQETEWAPNPRSIRAAFRAREATGHVGSKETLPVFLRVAGYGDRVGPGIPNPSRIVIDLNNRLGQVIVIDPDGWKVEGGWPFCFLRHRHMQQLPLPVESSVEAPVQNNDAPGLDTQPTLHRTEILTRFRSLLNPATTKDFHRILIWLLAAARGSGSCPVLALQGSEASGKSTATHFLRHTIDPSHGPHADHHARNRDLIDLAHSNWIVAFDTVRRLTSRVADFINALAGGITIHIRQPHDPHAPAATFLQRPVILNLQPAPGEKDPLSAHGPSLPARALRVNLAPLPVETRLASNQLSRMFEELRPQLLALLCTALAAALKNLPEVRPPCLPPLADAAIWAIAAAPALGLTEAEILAAFDDDPDLNQSPDLVEAIDQFLAEDESWTGTATDLHSSLPAAVVPKTPKLLSEQLRASTAELAAHLQITHHKTKSARLLTISRLPPSAPPAGDAEAESPASPTPESTAPQPESPAASTPSAAAPESGTNWHKIDPLRHPQPEPPPPPSRLLQSLRHLLLPLLSTESSPPP